MLNSLSFCAYCLLCYFWKVYIRNFFLVFVYETFQNLFNYTQNQNAAVTLILQLGNTLILLIQNNFFVRIHTLESTKFLSDVGHVDMFKKLISTHISSNWIQIIKITVILHKQRPIWKFIILILVVWYRYHNQISCFLQFLLLEGFN